MSLPEEFSDGQHRQQPQPGLPSGEKTRRSPGVMTGNLSGGEEHSGSRTITPSRRGDVSTEIRDRRER